MKETLNILKTNSSGLEDRESVAKTIRTDNEIVKKANSIDNIQEKENYLFEELKDLPTGFVKSKILLSEIIKDKNLKLACELLISASYYSPLETRTYIQYAKIALKNNAFKVAKSAIEASIWVFDGVNEELGSEISKLEEELILKSENEKDPNNSFWSNKVLNKISVLERLELQSSPRALIKYCFKLLDKFPEDTENLYYVFSILSSLDKKEPLEKFVSYIEKYLVNDEKNRSIYLGLAYFRLFEFKKSIELLTSVLKSDPINPRCLLFLSLNHLLMGNEKSFINVSSMIIPTSDSLFMSVYFINCAFSGFDMDKKEFPNQKEISKSTSKLLYLLLKNEQFQVIEHILSSFKKLDYYSILPSLPFYFCEVFILNKSLEYAKNVLDGLSNPEVHRFKAWIYRVEGKIDLAEEELLTFRKSIDLTKKSFTCKLISVDFPEVIPSGEEEIFAVIQKSYKEVKDLIASIDLEYGIETLTCIETACQDCCKKTFPFVSYVEYLYMRNWFDDQTEEYQKNIFSKSVDIVNRFKKQYGKEALFVVGDKNVRDEFPMDFFFDCPYLGDNKCNVHEARPFTCRAYGYGSQDGVKYKGCNYLYDQYKYATGLHDERKVVNVDSFYEFTSEVDRKLIGDKILAPIPAWFAQSHAETIEIIKSLISS